MSKLSENAKTLLTNFRELGWSYDDLAALVGVGRPTLMKYMHHPEQMALGEYDFLVSKSQEAIKMVKAISEEQS